MSAGSKIGSILTAALITGSVLAQPCDVHFARVHPFEEPDSGVEGLNVIDLGSGGELFLAGSFSNIGGLPFNKIGRFNGTSFSPIGQGLHPFVDNFIGCCSKGFTFARFDDATGPALYIGGDYVTAWETFPNTALLSIARWRPTGGTWETLDGLINADNCVADCPPRVHDSLVMSTPAGPALVIGGTFSTLGFFGDTPVASKYVGMRTATGWVSMAGGMSVVRDDNPEPAAVFTLEMFDDGNGPRLYAAGHFTHAGGVAADNIARWTGTAWEALPGGGIGPNGDEPPRGQINAMTVFNGSLIVGGEFTNAGSTTVSHIARWDGAQWHALGSGVDQQVRTLAVWDDGSGPSLYVGGEFTVAGGRSAMRIARWDGAAWHAVGDGLDSSPYAMAEFDHELYIGGYFQASGALSSPYLIKLAAPSCCIADFNRDGMVTVQDIFDFLAAWFGGTDPRADVNGDDTISVQDIFDFLAVWFGGCDT